MLNYNTTEKKIIKYIIENGKVYQNDIQKDLDIDKSNLSRFLNRALLENVLIKEKTGKKNIFYFNKNQSYTLNFEWNRLELDCFVANLYGEKIKAFEKHILDFNDIGFLYKAISDNINKFLKNYSNENLICICFAVHGIVASHSLVKHIPNCPWKNINLKDITNQYLKKEVLVENYTNLGAFYEKLLYYNNFSSLALVKLRTGIGGGLVIGNKIYDGHNGGTLEIGHLTLTPDSKTEYVDLIENHFIESCLEKYGFSSREDFINSYNQGNKNALELYQIFLKNWIFVLKNLSAIISPSVLLLYHDLLNQIPHCLFEIRTAFNEMMVSPKIIDFSKIKLEDYIRGINFLLLNRKFDLDIEKISF